jgi:Holliday junction resolvase RusA-like endonuclease
MEGDVMHTKKPDCDNLAKSILDALNGIAYDDDSQICSLTVHKFYGDTPRVEVHMGEFNDGKIHW